MNLRRIEASTARRLAVTAQRLDGGPRTAAAAGMKDVLRSLRAVQLDPINTVTRSHRLVLFSRLGKFAEKDLDRLRFGDRWLFEYWAHAASLVLTDDYPIHRVLMRTYPSGKTMTSRRTKEWIETNKSLRASILRRLRRDGPLPLCELDDRSVMPWKSGGWNDQRNVDRMIDVLWTQGRIMVTARNGNQKLWDLSERFWPEWMPRDRMTEAQKVRASISKALVALGVGTRKDINEHFVRFRYPGLKEELTRLEKQGAIQRVAVYDDGTEIPGPHYVHESMIATLDSIEAGNFTPRTTVLSPFDNLICDRARAKRLFGFDFLLEIYVPKAKRRFGYYVLSILSGDRIIGRIDAAMDRATGTLTLPAVHAEGKADASDAGSVAEAVRDLANFLEATDIAVGTAPRAWAKALRV